MIRHQASLMPGRRWIVRTGRVARECSTRAVAVTSVSGVDGTNQPITGYWPDSAAPRLAYTLNEGLSGLNKYVAGFQDTNAVRTYHNVNLNQVDNQSGTILATEWVDEWGIVSGVNRGGGAGVVSKAHRPVNPWRVSGGNESGDVDKTATAVAYLPDIPVGTLLRKSNAKDLWLIGTGGAVAGYRV